MSSINIPGYLIKEIEFALSDAFRSKSDLKMMLRHKFNLNIEKFITSGGKFDDVFFEIVQYFQNQNKLAQLIDKANQEIKENANIDGNEGNLQLIYIAKKFEIISSLIKILQPLEKTCIKQMQQAYTDCCPKNNDWDDDNDDNVENLNEILESLEEITGKEYDENLLQFVANLLNNQNIPSKSANQLKEWGNEYDKNFDKRLIRKNSPEAVSKTQPYLLVKINPSQQNQKQRQNQYLVSSWLITDENNYNYSENPENCKCLQNFLNEDEPDKSAFTIENDIPKLLKSFLLQRKEHLKTDKVNPPIVIFFLPLKLLNEEIEKIKPFQNYDDFKIPIGSQYCVVFRSVERLSKKYDSEEKWSERWNKFKDNSNKNCSDNFQDIDVDYHDFEKFKNKLFSSLERNNKIFAIKLNKIPREDIFKVIDCTGIPITLWLRKNDFQGSESKTIDDDFDELLTCEINKLPDIIKQKRLEALEADTDEHIGNHIGLLWENPYLRPPKAFQFRTP